MKSQTILKSSEKI